MKQTSIKILSIFTLFICFTMLPLRSFAQGPVDPEDTPIDGGLSMLLAAGAAYGIKKYRDNRKQQHEDNDIL